MEQLAKWKFPRNFMFIEDCFERSFKIPRSISGMVSEALYYDLLQVGLLKEGFIGKKILWGNTGKIYTTYIILIYIITYITYALAHIVNSECIYGILAHKTFSLYDLFKLNLLLYYLYISSLFSFDSHFMTTCYELNCVFPKFIY